MGQEKKFLDECPNQQSEEKSPDGNQFGRVA